jgi:hypothetical protein
MSAFSAAAYSGIPKHVAILNFIMSGTEKFFKPMVSRFEVHAVRIAFSFQNMFSACFSDPMFVQ